MKKIILPFIVMMMLILGGCEASPPVSPSEEAVMYSWSLKNENEGNINEKPGGSLSFNDDRICLKLKKADGSELKIDGFFEIDDNHIIIISEKYGTVNLKYSLTGNELRLAYNDSALVFTKEI